LIVGRGEVVVVVEEEEERLWCCERKWGRESEGGVKAGSGGS